MTFLPTWSSAQEGDPQLQVPDTLEEAREKTAGVIDNILGAIPQAIARIWNNEVVPAWRAMEEWAKEELWEKRAVPAGQAMADQIKKLLGQEIEKRKPFIKQELEKEKEEFKEELKRGGEKAGKSLWERFLALFRKE